MGSLTEKAQNILNEKINKITPENLKPGINIFNVVSNMTNYGDLEITPNANGSLYNSGYVNSINIIPITNFIEPNLISEHIANGIEIFGVTGNFSGATTEIELSNQTTVVFQSYPFTDAPLMNTCLINKSNNMFRSCMNLVNVPNYNLSNVTNADYMFRFCSNITDIPNFNLCNVTSMQYTFANCINLVNISDINLSNVINIYAIFFGCEKLVNAPNLNIINAKNIRSMFDCCYSLVNVPNYDTSNATSVSYMFYHCTSLVNVPNFDTSNVTNMGCMFVGCNNLINVPNFDTSNVTFMDNMFNGCYNLVNIPNFDASNVISMGNMFTYCNKLSNDSIQNIVSMCINAVNMQYKNLSNSNLYSPLYHTKFNKSYYQNKCVELDAAGWAY